MTPVITLEVARTHLAHWHAASLAAATGSEKSMQTGPGQGYTVKYDPGHVLNMIKYWSGEVARLEKESDPVAANASSAVLANFNI